MELRNITTGGVFSCDDEMGNRLLTEGGYEKAGKPAEKPAEAPKAAPVKHAPRKAAGA